VLLHSDETLRCLVTCNQSKCKPQGSEQLHRINVVWFVSSSSWPAMFSCLEPRVGGQLAHPHVFEHALAQRWDRRMECIHDGATVV